MDKEAHSTSQTKRMIEAKSREIAKKVKTYHTADWGDYNVNFSVPGTGCVQDVPQFLKQLDALSVFPTTRQDIIAQLTSDLRTLKSKNELLVEQQSKLQPFSAFHKRACNIVAMCTMLRFLVQYW